MGEHKHIIDAETSEVVPILGDVTAFSNYTDEVAYGVIAVPPHTKTKIVPESKRKKTKRKLDYEWLIWNTTAARRSVKMKRFNDNEKLFMHDIVPFTNYRCVPCNDDDENYYMSIGDMERLLGWSRRRTSETVQSLEDKNMLVRVPYGKGKYIMFNPVEFHRGNSDKVQGLIDTYEEHRNNYCKHKSDDVKPS